MCSCQAQGWSDRAGLEQQHARLGILAQPAREHAAGRAGADHDVIEGFGFSHLARPPQRGAAAPPGG